MMTTDAQDTVRIDRHGEVLVVTIDRPERRNAVDGRTARHLYDATIRLPRLIGQSRAMDLILTGRTVAAEEALQIGLANRVVEPGEALSAAISLARELADFPQRCLRADRLSMLAQWSLDEDEAIAHEMRGGLSVIASGETVAGASAFAAGKGRHGSFERG